MRRTESDIERLKAELIADRQDVAEVFRSNRKAIERIEAGADDDLDFGALGYTIHNLYGLMENSCQRIAGFFENNLSRDSWHKDLLERMRLEIDGIRPAFLEKEIFLILDDLRAFRHVFRNLYGRPIDRDKCLLVQAKVSKAVSGYDKAVEKYLGFLDEMVQSGLKQ